MAAEKVLNEFGNNFENDNFGNNFGGNNFGDDNFGNNYGNNFGGDNFGNTPDPAPSLGGSVGGENVASTAKAFALGGLVGKGSVGVATGFGKMKIFIIIALIVIAIIAIYFIYTTFFKKKECKYSPRQSAGKD